MLKLKQVIIVILLMFAGICCTELPVSAEVTKGPVIIDRGSCGATENDDLKWLVYDTDYNGDADVLEISGTGAMADYDGIQGGPWRSYKGELNQLIFEDGITSIGKNAFYEYTGFTGDLIIPNSVTVINYAAFYGCSGFDGTLKLPEKLLYIGGMAFNNCSGFTGTIVIPNGVKEIWEVAFGNMNNIAGEVVIPASVEVINAVVFENCKGIEKITFLNPDTEIYVYDGLCPDTTVISSFVRSTAHEYANNYGYKFDAIEEWGDGVRAYGDCGETLSWVLSEEGELKITGTGEMYDYFSESDGEQLVTSAPWKIYKDKITRLVFEDGITSIGNSAFCGLNSLSGKLLLPDSLSCIGAWAFYGCSGFEGTLVIPDGVKEIWEVSFGKMNNIVGEIKIPESVELIDGIVFDDCNGVEKITFLNPNTVILDDNGLCPETTIISGYKNSTAYEYASKYNYDFELLFCETHRFDDGVVKKQATFETEGIKTRTCSVCAEITEETISKIAYVELGEKNVVYDGNEKKPKVMIEDTLGNALVENEDYTVLYYDNVEIGDASAEITFIGEYAGTATMMFEICDPASKVFSYIISPDGVTITGLVDESVTDIVIPEMIEGRPVTTIGASAFSGNNSLLSLKFPNSLKSIGDYSFSGCTNLSGKLLLPDSLSCIGAWAFYRCNGFTGDLVIPEGVTSIGEFAFYICSGFTGDLVIPESVTSIGRSAFSDCSGFTGNLMIQEGVTSIGEGAFSGCSGFTGDLVIPESVTSIGRSAFSSCSGFTGDLMIQEGVTSIGEGAFSGCSGFTGDLVIPEGVTSIGISAFRGCSGFTGNLVIPEGVTSIGISAFRGCSGFTGDLVIPESVTSIGRSAFSDCSGFTGNLMIQEGVTSIGEGAFSGCSGFTGDLVIPEGVTSIGASAFEGCSGFTGDLVISKGVTSIEEFAFCECSGFTGDLVISEGVISIGMDAFRGCSGFTGNLVIPKGVTSIGEAAFYECSGFTGDLVISKGVTSIGEFAFYDCSGFTGDLVISEGVISIGMDAFRGCSGFTGNLVIPEGVTSIGGSAFSGCSGFTGNLVIPEGVTNIGSRAFEGCSGFTGDLIILEGVTNIEEFAFYGCSGFTGNLVIPEGVTNIGEFAFGGCNNIEMVLILNRECVFDPTVFPKKIIYSGYIDSTVHNYAKEYDCTFVCYVHDWEDDYTVDKKATREIDGRKSIHCSVCDETKDEVVITGIGGVGMMMDELRYAYDGSEKTPTIFVTDTNSVLLNNNDYTVEYFDNVKVGQASVIVTFQGDYEGSVKMTFEIYNEIQSISIEKMPTITKYGTPSYFSGNGGQVRVTFSDGTYEILDMQNGVKTSTGDELLFERPWIETLGQHEIIFECGDAVTSLRVERCAMEVYDVWDGVSSLDLNPAYEYNTYILAFTPKESGLYEFSITNASQMYCNWWISIYQEKDGVKLTEVGIDGIRQATLVANHTYYLAFSIYGANADRIFSGPIDAQCVCVEPENYTVAYDANGGNEAPDVQYKIAGKELTLASSKPSMAYTVMYDANGGNMETKTSTVKVLFKCWNTRKDGTGASYGAGATYSFDANVTLYAQYEKSAKIGKFPTPTWDGYTFNGWFTKATGGKQVTENTEISSDVTLYAQWTKNDPVYNDQVESFVARLYNECLIRNPEAAGLADWTNQLKSGTLTGTGAAYGIVFSQEYKNRSLCNEDFVENLYNAFMGRKSDAAGKADWVGRLESGVSREAVFNGFAMSAEFANLCAEYGILVGSAIDEPQKGTGATGTCSVCGKNNSLVSDGVSAFVTRLYTICLGRTPDEHGLNDWSGQLRNHTNTGRGVAFGFIFSPEFTNKNLSNDQYVECLYNAFFDRPADAGGKADWMNRLNMGWSREQVFDGFVGSQEFTNLCNKYGITRD